MTQEEIAICAKFVSTCIAVVMLLLGGILGSLLQHRFDFWKW